MAIKNMGDLRVFLAEVMEEVRSGKITSDKATAVSKLAAQINSSIHSEIAARTHLELKSLGFNDLSIIGTEFVEPKKLPGTKVNIAVENDGELTQKQKEKIIELKKAGKTLGEIVNTLLPKSKSQNKEMSDVFYNWIG
jgi:hypothetical protein